MKNPIFQNLIIWFNKNICPKPWPTITSLETKTLKCGGTWIGRFVNQFCFKFCLNYDCCLPIYSCRVVLLHLAWFIW